MNQRSPRIQGIHAATVCPMRSDFSIDEDALARHVAEVASHDGVEGLLINGHAGENFMLERSELKRVVEVVRAATPQGCFLTSGVISESALETARQAADAQAAGADAVLVFPPFSWALGQDPDVVARHHRCVADACSLPIVLYQAPVSAGSLSYRPETLERLMEMSEIAAVKEGSWEVAAFEANLRLFRGRRPDIAVLGSGDEHLLTSYLIGGDGSQVSLAAVAPDAVVSLWRAAQRGDWSEARAWHEQLYALIVAIYRREPTSRATARLKACLALLDSTYGAHVRPPQASPSSEDMLALASALESARGSEAATLSA